MRRINNSPIDYGQCDRCGYKLIQFSPDDMCMICDWNLDTVWCLRHTSGKRKK